MSFSIITGIVFYVRNKKLQQSISFKSFKWLCQRKTIFLAYSVKLILWGLLASIWEVFLGQLLKSIFAVHLNQNPRNDYWFCLNYFNRFTLSTSCINLFRRNIRDNHLASTYLTLIVTKIVFCSEICFIWMLKGG